MPQFVLLHHECPDGTPRATHWDFMFEEAGRLRTWVVHQPPSVWMHRPVDVEEIQPHRIEYLELEGPLSGGRGSVTRVDRGTLEPREQTDARVCVQLGGQVLRGALTLTRSSADAPWWRLSFAATNDPAG